MATSAGCRVPVGTGWAAETDDASDPEFVKAALGCRLVGGLATGAGRWVDSRDSAVDHVLGPCGSRPVAVLVPAGGVDKPTGGDPRARDLARRRVDGLSRLVSGRGAGERARRTWNPRLPFLPATPRRQDPYHEERDEDDQEEPGTVTVIERDLRLLGRVSLVNVGRYVGPAGGCPSVVTP